MSKSAIRAASQPKMSKSLFYTVAWMKSNTTTAQATALKKSMLAADHEFNLWAKKGYPGAIWQKGLRDNQKDLVEEAAPVTP